MLINLEQLKLCTMNSGVHQVMLAQRTRNVKVDIVSSAMEELSPPLKEQLSVHLAQQVTIAPELPPRFI